MPTEPIPTAALLVTFGTLMAVSVLVSRASERLRVPVLLLFILIGMAAGSEGVGGLWFEDYALTFRVGTVALALILFDGGLNTSMRAVREAVRPAAVLATVGVVATAAIVGACARLLGASWAEGMLLGAIVSSTDAAAVFALLRNSGLVLKRRVGVTLELESGLNDPVAVILTMTFTGVLVSGEHAVWRMVADLLSQLAIGAVLGVAIGYGARALLRRARLPTGGLYPVLTVAVACLAFGVPTLMAGSGFLSVYVAAIILGAGPLPHRLGLLRVHDAIAWFAQVAMFVLLGLLAFPSRVIEAAPMGLALALCLALVARPVVVALCLAPFRFPLKESGFVGWVGLRGAVPIILATYPVMAGAPGADRIFDIVFSIVVVGTFIPGSTVAWLTRRLGLESDEPPRPRAVVEIESSEPLDADVLSFYIEPAAAVAGARMADLPFPPGAAAMLVVRGRELIAPRGGTVLQPGDHVFVCARREDQGTLQLLFGRMEENRGEDPAEMEEG